MILREYLEILDKHDMWCSHLPDDSQLAKMTESSLEKQCLDIEKIFDEVYAWCYAPELLELPKEIKQND